MPDTSPKPRRALFTLRPQPLSREELCSRVNACASRHLVWYHCRLGLEVAGVLLAQAWSLALALALPLAFPWAARDSVFLRPLYENPLLRFLMFALIYLFWIPFSVTVLAAAVRAVTLRLAAPEGVRLTREAAPRLFRTLGDFLARLDAGPVQGIVLSARPTIKVHQLPQLGVLGCSSNWLELGLSALEAVSPQQFRALLAHELALLPTRNREFGGWARGLRERLIALRDAAEKNAMQRGYWRRWPDSTLADLLDRIVLRLGAWTLPAARRHQSEADVIAASIAGRDFAAAALLRRRIAAHALNHGFREECMRLATALSDPPADLFEQRAEAARGALGAEQVNAWLRVELEKKDNCWSSSGLLWDRIRTLGYPLAGSHDFHDLMEQAQPHRELGESAARHFLGEELEGFREHFFREWREAHQGDWRRRFETFEGLRQEAAAWNSSARETSTDPEKLWRIAVAVGNTQGWRAALPVAARILEVAPEHSDANLLTGQCLLEDGNAAGLARLDCAMEADPATIPAACSLAARFLEARGEKPGAEIYSARAQEHRKQAEAAASERRHARPTDAYQPASVPAEALAAIRAVLEPCGSLINAAYLTRKCTPHDAKKPCLVLGIERRMFVYEDAARANRLLLRQITGNRAMPPDVLVCVVTRANRALLARWKGVAGSLLLRRARWHDGLLPGQGALPRPVPAPHDHISARAASSTR